MFTQLLYHMKCRNAKCRREIEPNSIFCNWCGTKQIKENNVERTPKARKLPSGAWTIQLMIGGQRLSQTFSSEKDAVEWAKEQKRNAEEIKSNPSTLTVDAVIDRYIDSKSNILSPSTIVGYKQIKRNRFREFQKRRVCTITDELAQSAVNEESKSVSAKTVVNSWVLINSACKAICGKSFEVTLPVVQKSAHEFIQPTDLPRFIEAARGSRSESAILLGLHSLRLSEILALTPADIAEGKIRIHSSKVDSEEGKVLREQNKTALSTRIVPVLIPRLNDLVDTLPVELSQKQLYDDVNGICDSLGIPRVGIHGLRHSFASLCHYCKISELQCQVWGGWKTNNILRSVYTHISNDETEQATKTIEKFLTNY